MAGGWGGGRGPSGLGSSEAGRRSRGLPLRRSSPLTRCCLDAAGAEGAGSGLRRFLVRRRMICSPLFCLMMLRGLGVWRRHRTGQKRGGGEGKEGGRGGKERRVED